MRFILLISFFLLLKTGNAQQPVSSLSSSDKKSVGNKTIDTISPVVVLHDPKEGFKDLFLNKPDESNYSTVQLNPRAISFVQDYMQKNKKSLEKLKGWGLPYFDMIDAVLTYHGLPRELKYLAVIESYLKTYAVSWAGAVGPWQFMPATARRFGLQVNAYMDERTDYYKSTHAAAKYLAELYNIYDDWLLVIAAYNGGPGTVDAAIRKSKSRDFWELQHYLNAESRDHVKKFIATHYIMEGEGGVTTLTKNETVEWKLTSSVNPATKNLNEAELNNSKVQVVSGRYNSLIIAKHITFPITEFNRYNPDFDKLISLNSKYELRLPADKMDLFVAKRYDILNESIQVLLNEFKQSLSVPDKVQPVKKSSK
jgi:membrane-bound lytic murein transglycosylase D